LVNEGLYHYFPLTYYQKSEHTILLDHRLATRVLSWDPSIRLGLNGTEEIHLQCCIAFPDPLDEPEWTIDDWQYLGEIGRHGAVSAVGFLVQSLV